MTLATAFTEADWECLVLDRLGDHGWRLVHGDKIAPGPASAPAGTSC